MPRRRPHLSFGRVLSHLGVIVIVSAVLGVLAAGLVVPLVGALGYATGATARSMQNLPAELKAAPLAQRTRVLDRDGKPIAIFYDENRVNVSLDRVAPIMKRAMIAIEDYRFYKHGALDLKGTLRAFVSNQTSSTGTQGGSSITQQMAKMTQLTQARTEAERRAATENTYQRKIQELRHAIAFEQNYSKDWILERYLNLAYFGDGAYGIQAAARHYFSVNASQLNTVQAATLAGLVKNPVGFDPTAYQERALARRNVVLTRMAELNVVRPTALAGLTRAPLGLKVSLSRNGCLGTKAPFFCDYVRRYLMADRSLGRTAADRAQLLTSGGLTIKTTIDLGYQRAADGATEEAVRPKDQAIGALAMVQPGTGEVLSIPQNDFATCNGPYPVYSPWNLGNSTGSGNFDMVTGTRKSVNTYFAQLERKTGLCEPYALAKAMGVDLTSPDTERVPSFVLGVAGVSPLEMASAYATFAARGKHCDARPVTQILNSEGKVFKNYPKACQQVMQEPTADTVNSILAGVLAPGGFGQALALNKASAGKTGTINSNMAVWFNGYTPALSTAAMIAGANSEGQPITLNGANVGGRTIGEAFGSTVAGPMWAQAMRAVQDDLPDETFTPPVRSTEGQIEVEIPDVTGMSTRKAAQRLAGAGFYVSTGDSRGSSEPEGTVAATSPNAGESVSRGSTVYLYPSSGG